MAIIRKEGLVAKGNVLLHLSGRKFIRSEGKGDPNIGTVRYTKDIGNDKAEVWEYEAELIYGEIINTKGKPETVAIGWKQTSTPHLLRTVDYEGAKGRLDRGFQNIMTEFGTSKVSPDEIARLKSEWYKLSDDQKANVWNSYREWLDDNHYGSFPNENAKGVVEVDSYVEEISKLIASA